MINRSLYWIMIAYVVAFIATAFGALAIDAAGYSVDRAMVYTVLNTVFTVITPGTGIILGYLDRGYHS